MWLAHDECMTRLQIAEEYAERARMAQCTGDHRRAAELFAEALRLLALPFQHVAEELNDADIVSERGRSVGL
jgi:hypothetical protein